MRLKCTYNNSFYVKAVDCCAGEYLGSIKNALLVSIKCCNRSRPTLIFPLALYFT